MLNLSPSTPNHALATASPCFFFKRHARLKSKKRIQALFARGKSRSFGPIRVVHEYSSLPHPSHQVLFAVPKKKIKRAVDRNKIKRKMREAYRLHQPYFLSNDTTGRYFLMAYIYQGTAQAASFMVIEKATMAALRYLNQYARQALLS